MFPGRGARPYIPHHKHTWGEDGRCTGEGCEWFVHPSGWLMRPLKDHMLSCGCECHYYVPDKPWATWRIDGLARTSVYGTIAQRAYCEGCKVDLEEALGTPHMMDYVGGGEGLV